MAFVGVLFGATPAQAASYPSCVKLFTNQAYFTYIYVSCDYNPLVGGYAATMTYIDSGSGKSYRTTGPCVIHGYSKTVTVSGYVTSRGVKTCPAAE